MIRALRLDSGPPLFYLIERPIVGAVEAFSLSDKTIRALSFLALAALFASARSLPVRARPRLVWLMAASPLLLLYSTEGRVYGVLALAAFLLFRLAAREPIGTGSLAAMTFLAALLPWLHYLGIVMVGSLLAGAVLLKRWRAAASLSLGLALFLPWMPILLEQPRAATSWIRDGIGTTVGGFLAALGGSARLLPPFGRPLPDAMLWLGGAAGVGLLALVIASRPSDLDTRLGLCAVLLTLGGIVAASLWRPIAVAGRSEMVILPIWIWLAASAAERSPAVRRMVGGVIAISLISTVLILTTPRARVQFAAVPQELEASARSGDLVLATGNFYLPALLERDRGRLSGELRAFPDELASHPGWFLGAIPPDGDSDRLAGELLRAGPERRISLLLDTPYWTPRLRQFLLERGPLRTVALPRTGIWVTSVGRAAAVH